MTKKAYYNWDDVEGLTQDIIRQLTVDNRTYDCVVGLTRGGLTPAVLVSQYLDIPMHTLKVSLRDHIGHDNILDMKNALGVGFGKNILVIDDINDTGATINAIKEVWHDQYVDYVVLINNEASEATVDFSAVDINKHENDVWIVFPWEDWWI
jgi:hypoxanthine phosphoribosyltransferase